MTDRATIKQDAIEAKDLLESRIFQKAIIDCRKRSFQQLMSDGYDDSGKLRLVAFLQALESIPQELAGYINNDKMQEKR